MKLSRRGILKVLPLSLAAALLPARVRELAAQGGPETKPIPADQKPKSIYLVVAAYNSARRDRSDVDYVCDGVADQQEIQEAIDSLPPGGEGAAAGGGLQHQRPHNPA